MIPFVLTIAPPIHRSEFRERCQRCSGARLQRLENKVGSRCLYRCDRQSKRERRESEGLKGKCCRGFLRGNQVLVLGNYRMMQTNRYAKTSFLQFGKMPSKVWEWTKVVFAPTGRIPSFEGEAPWRFLRSVAEAPTARSLLIQLQAYNTSNKT